MDVVNTRKCTHEEKPALPIKEAEVDTAMWMEDDRERERGEKGVESLGACLVVRGPRGPRRRPPLAERSKPGGAGTVVGLQGRGQSV